MAEVSRNPPGALVAFFRKNRTSIITWLFSGIGGSLLFFGLGQYVVRRDLATPVDIHGTWLVEVHPTGQNSIPAIGVGSITQEKGSPVFALSGEVSNINKVKDTTPGAGDSGNDYKFEFWSLFAGIDGQDIYIFYENDLKEKGVCEGKISSASPARFTLSYTDLYDHDENEDFRGEIRFVRQ